MFDPQTKFSGEEFQHAPPGSMAWQWVKPREPPHEMYAAICLRVGDGDAHSKIPKDFKIEMKCKPVPVYNVAVVLFLLKIVDYPTLFCSPINLWSEVYKSPLHAWRDSETSVFHFYESNPSPVRTDELCSEYVGRIFAPVVEAVEKMRMWTEEDFNKALRSMYVSPEDVWDK